MAEDEIKNQPSLFPEKDIERIGEAVKEIQQRPEFQKSTPQEIIKESLKSFTPPPAPPPQTPPAQAGPPEENGIPFLPDYMKSEPAEKQKELERLLTVAINQGFFAGIKEAQKDGEFLLDAFHDSLADKVYPELKRRGFFME